MKHLLLAVSVVALTAGSAFAQSDQGAPGAPPAAPSAPAPGAGSAAPGAGTMGMPKAAAPRAVHRAARSSSRVREAQQALKEEGLYKGKIDGKFGPQTRSAVAQFQKQNGLKQTAHLDRATMSKLMHGGGSAGGGGSMPQGGGMPNGGTTSQ